MKTNQKGIWAVASAPLVSSITTRFSVLLLSCLLWSSVGWGQTTETFTTAGSINWVCPAGVSSVTVQAWGGGGGGGYATGTTSSAGGGGGGAYASSTVNVSPGTSYTIVVGAGGTAGIKSGSVPAGNGGNSSFNSTSVVAAGGSASTSTSTSSTNTTGGSGGTIAASTGTTKFAGGTGGTGTGTGGGGGGGAAASISANGANGSGITGGVGISPAGSGGSGISNSAGNNGLSYGGGGSGGNKNGTGNNGSAGAAGAVILTYTLPACSGTPSPGNTVATVNPVPGGSSTSLSLQNATSGSGVTYQWQSSSDNTNWSNITGATSATYTASPTVATYYRCNVTCSGNTGTSNSLLVNLTYCTPSMTSISASGDYIANVTFAGINNTSGDASTDYTYYSNLTASVYIGNSFNISLLSGGTSSTYAQQFGVWIDYNQNSLFTDPGEFVYATSVATFSPSVSTGVITIPSASSSVLTGITRMRVGSRYSSAVTSTNSCIGGSTYGEYEDYNISISLPNIVLNASFSLFSSCTGSASTAQSFSVSGTNLGANLVVTAPTGFEVSTTQNGTYSSSVSYAPISGTVSSQTVWVRMSATASGSPSGNIAVSSTGATTQNIAVSGSLFSTPTPTFTSAPGGTSCLGVNITYTTQSGMSNYIWTFPGVLNADYTIVSGGTSSDNTVTLQWLTSGSKSVTVNYTNANGCTGASAAINLTSASAQPTLTGLAYSSATYCSSLTSSGSPMLSGTNSAGGTYSSSNGLTINSSTGDITPSSSTVGQYTVTYTISSSGGCSAVNISTTVEIIAAPNITTQPSTTAQSICGVNSSATNLSVVANGNGGSISTYQWYSNTSATTTNSISLSGANASSYTPSTASAGTLYYYATVTNTNGCSVTSAVSAGVTVIPSLSGTYTVGVGGNYTTLTAAVAAYNSSCLSGPVVFSLTDATYSTNETFPITINANSYASSTNTLTIKPASGVTSTISGSSGASSSIFKLNGADFIILDGSNNGTNSKDLSIINTYAGSSYVVWLGSTSSSNGATNNTIRNCIIQGQASTTTTTGIVVATATASGGAAADKSNDNITINNNSINTCQNGIWFNGNATILDNNLVISQNSIGSSVAINKLGYRGIIVQNAQNFAINDNNISGVISSTSSTNTMTGLTVGGLISTGSIYNNIIKDIKQTNTTGYGSNGIAITSTSTTSNLKVYNNFISDISSIGYSTVGITDNGYGIIVTAGGGYNIYFNTINLNTNQTTGVTAGINVTSGVTTSGAINLVNNIIANTQTTNTRYSIYSAAASSVFGTINYNNYYSSGTNLGYIGSARASLSAIQTGFGQNTNSISVQPSFTSSTDLHLTLSGNCSLNNAGTPLAGITTDYDGDTRNASTPDIGADEFTGVNTASAPSATPTLCANTALTAITHTTTGATGISGAGVSGANTLPAGVSATWANNIITISGTPTAPGTFNYSIPLTGGCANVFATGTITVNQTNPPTGSSNQTLCTNATVADLNATGTNVQWFAASTGGSALTSTTALANGSHYFAEQTANACTSSTRLDVTVQLQNQWLGASSSDWSVNSNWSCGVVPNATDDALIPSTNITNLPSLSVDAGIKNISVGSTVILNGKTLTINGTISGTAAITGSASSGLVIAGAAGTINMTNTNTTDNVLNTLTINNGASATVGSNGIKIAPGGTVTVNGTLTLTGNLRLQSDATATARVAQSTGTITGALTQERYVPGKAIRKWSFIASPVTQSLASAWQQQIHITGAGTGGTMCNNYTISGTMTPHTNGFDVTQLQNPSFYTYDAATDNFVANTTGTTNYTLTPGVGYMVLVRGDRNDATNGGCVLLSANNQAAFTSTPVTLAATGAVGQGTITKVLPVGYSFIGNPYPCEIDFPSFNTTNASVITGGYWTYYPTNATYTFSTYNNGTSTNGGTQVIANGQSFLVNSTSGGTITFNEAHKSTTANNGNFRLTKTWDELIRVGLSNNQGNRFDEVVVRFGNDAAITKALNEYDAASVNGGDQWIKTLKEASELAIQTRPNTYQNDTVSLAMHAKNAGTYQLNFSEYQGLSNTEVYLIDQQENLIQNVKALPSYEFSVGANTTTANRFKLIFDAKTSGVAALATKAALQVYPNPTKDKVRITCDGLENGVYQIKVRTITGAEVLKAKGTYYQNEVIELSLQDLAAGMYMLELTQDNGLRAIQKITKQ